jgi:rhomboid protease GluP
MPNCKNCGRELPTFPSGESSDLCESCQTATVVSASRPQARRVVRPSRRVTQVLLGINVVVFLAMVMSGASLVQPSNEQLLQFGANWGPLSLGSQPWRLLTANYVHVGIVHIALNMWCLWDLGGLAELIFGSSTYSFIYLLCGLGGSIASVWWHPLVVGAGASGAIFGLAGALIAALYLGHLPFPKQAMQQTLRSLFIFAAYNLFFGAVSVHVDNSAHIGGLVTGLAIGAVLAKRLHGSPEIRQRWTRSVLAVVSVVLLSVFILVRRVNAQVVFIGQALNSMQKGRVDEAIARLERTTTQNPNDATAFMLLGTAYLDKRDYAKAETALQKAAALKPDYFAAQFNLGLAQMQLGKPGPAVASLQAAARLDPKNSDVQQALAEALKAQGRNDEANAALRKAEELRKAGH